MPARARGSASAQVEHVEGLGQRAGRQAGRGGEAGGTEAGTYLSNSTVTRGHFARLLRRAGLPPARFHDLRHTFATLALAAGVHVKVVSEMLGHASIAITLEVYGHVLPDMQERAVATMGDVLFGGRPVDRSVDGPEGPRRG